MKRSLALVITITILSTVVFSACAASPVSKSTQPQNAQPQTAQSGHAPAGASKSATAPGLSSAPITAGAPAQPAASGATSTANQPAANATDWTSWDRMIIRNADLTLTVKSVENSLTAIRAIADAAGGLTTQSNTRYDGERQMANITIQVPSSAFDETVSQIRKLAIKVETETSSTQDVTGEYTDLQSQLHNLQVTEDSLLSLQAKANTVDDILRLQQELTNVRGQIEQIQGRINYLSHRTEMSSISVSLVPEGAPSPSGHPAWNPLETAAKAWNISAVFLQGFADVLITLMVFFWWMVPLAVAFGLWLRSRRQQPKTSS